MANDKNPEALLKEGKVLILPPTGFSMYPFINPDKGDRVRLEPCSPDNLKRGDVVLYRRSNGVLILHRIWKERDNLFYMVGDNQKEIEGPIYPGQISGIMTELIKNNKTIKVTSLSYCVKSGLWLLLRPLRPIISKTIAFLKGRR